MGHLCLPPETGVSAIAQYKMRSKVCVCLYIYIYIYATPYTVQIYIVYVTVVYQISDSFMFFHHLKSSNLTLLQRGGGAWYTLHICTPCSVFIDSFDLQNRDMLTLAAAGVSLVNLWVCWRQRWSVCCLPRLRMAGEWEFLRFLVFLFYYDFRKQT